MTKDIQKEISNSPEVSVSESVKQKVVDKNSMIYKRDKDREKVKGIFRFYEVPGGLLTFVFRAYKGDPIETYNMIDGQVYEIPLGVAKHLNKNGWYPIHQYMTDENGKNIAKIGQKVRRFGFQSLEFFDADLIEETSIVATGQFV